MWQPHGSAFRLLTYFIQLLQVLESLPYLPANAILLTADVTSLYTNIPDKEGLETVLHYIITCQCSTPRCSKPPHKHNTTWNNIEEQQPFIHGQTFSPTLRYSHRNQSRPPYANLFISCQKGAGDATAMHPQYFLQILKYQLLVGAYALWFPLFVSSYLCVWFCNW